MEHQTVSIIGGGIAGLSAAIALRKIGIEAHIFEAAERILPVGAGLGLGSNAMLAFKELGIYNEVVQLGRAIPAFSIYDHCGKVITKTSFDGSAEIKNFAIHRAALHTQLLSQLDPARIHLGKRIKTFENTDFGVKLEFIGGATYHTNYVIVADGIHSVIRQQLLPATAIRYAGYTCWRSITDNGALGIRESSETWGPNGRFGIVPLAGNSLYWFACINASAKSAAFRRYKTSDLINHFGKYHAPIPAILGKTDDRNLIHSDIIDIEPLTQFAFDRVVLIGDAAHATTPNMGQGACQAIEDAVVIAQCMLQNFNYTQAFKEFEKRRLERTRWVTKTSFQLGKAAQIENSFMIALRNTVLRNMPASLRSKQLQKIESVDFNQI